MSSAWLDILKAPMAAPETSGLRLLRLTILSLAIALAVSIAMLKLLSLLLGIGAGGAIAGLLAALAALVPVYVFRKNRADDAYLEELVRAHGGREDCIAACDAARTA